VEWILAPTDGLQESRALGLKLLRRVHFADGCACFQAHQRIREERLFVGVGAREVVRYEHDGRCRKKIPVAQQNYRDHTEVRNRLEGTLSQRLAPLQFDRYVAGGSRRFHPFVAEFGKHDGRRMELVASAKVAAQVLEPGTSSLRLTLNRLSYAAFGKPPHVNRYGGTRKYEQHGSNRCGWSQRPGISTMVVTRDNDGSRLWIRQRSTDTLSIAKVGSVSAFFGYRDR